MRAHVDNKQLGVEYILKLQVNILACRLGEWQREGDKEGKDQDSWPGTLLPWGSQVAVMPGVAMGGHQIFPYTLSEWSDLFSV